MKKFYNLKSKNDGLLRLTNESHNIRQLLMDNLVELDDKFKFDNAQCSKLCKGHIGNTLYPHDIYAMSKVCGITTKDFVDKYCEMYASSQLLSPRVRFKVVGNEKMCIMYENGKCQICNEKPLMCSSYPISVFVAGIESGKTITGYVLDKSVTSSKGKTYTVREWLANNDVDEKDEFTADFVEMCELVQNTLLQGEKGNVPEEIIKALSDAIIAFLYSNYDTSIDFSEQFLANKQRLQELCSQIQELKNNK